jgi:hypothetical protein
MLALPGHFVIPGKPPPAVPVVHGGDSASEVRIRVTIRA